MKIDGVKTWFGEDELPSKDDEERWQRLNLSGSNRGTDER